MSLVTKLAAVGIGGGALAVGSTYLFKHINDVMPPWHSLALDNNYSTNQNGYTGKYGATYSNYLAGVDESKNNEELKDNDPWWNWIYLNRFKKVTGIKGKFKNAKQSVGGDDSLKKMCSLAYKETNKNGNHKIKTEDQISDDEFLEEDIWKFCSPIGQKPTTLSDSKNTNEKSEYENKLGSDQTNSPKFISVNDPGNTIFWEIRQKEFFSESGKFSPKEESDEKFFKPFYEAEKQKPEGQRKTIKDKCKEAYLKPTETSGTNTNPSLEKIVKFCSLDGQ